MAAFNLNSPELKQRLAETIAWCDHHPTAKLDDLQPHLKVLQKANELMSQAYLESRKQWRRLLNRDYRKSRKYLYGAALLQEADPPASFLIAQLRSPALNPSCSLTEAKSEQEREAAVEFVVAQRARSFAGKSTGTTAGLAGGRLLVYWPRETVADGASQAVTSGFFDVEDAPPWDTWVSYSSDTLLSWVPAQLVDLVQDGIEANCVDCIRWLA